MKDDLNILIIDSDPAIVAGLEKSMKRLGFALCRTAAPDSTTDQLKSLSPDLAILGPSSDTSTCIKCIQKLKIIDPIMPILTSCDDGCLQERGTSGPFEGVYYLNPDMVPGEISKAIDNALKHKAESDLRPDFPVIIGQSREIKDIRKKIRNVSDKDITVLITGETGTGKELIARSIHYHSSRSRGPLVKINCGALPDELLESEIFGFQRGAFTGAHKDKPGRLEMANGGTLFVDEIGDLSLSLQVKFLEVLEGREFSRLGGTEDKIIDTRVVAATNSDLWKKVREGTFRKDIFYRLNVMKIKASSLRRRKDDIPLLTHYFLNKYCFEFKKELMHIPAKITDLFLAYQWPGNVRELENVIRRAIVLRDWNFIYKELDMEKVDREKEHVSSSEFDLFHPDRHDDRLTDFFEEKDFSLKKVSKAYVSEAERYAIMKSLEETQWNRRKAAQLLKVSYKTLLNRIDEFDLKP
ncbi:MAG: sigma-54-dependent Fis family transcriptional regulator [Deltaproteobacteria bacterium]|nr:sigma-54-dependent Fis family transcriptional regulator [Deltaproteobacteria bacterium]MBW2345164.1 sigma-54-dependent Fis family transcriptional regulator [Deltaproteobacteria bacterium]